MVFEEMMVFEWTEIEWVDKLSLGSSRLVADPQTRYFTLDPDGEFIPFKPIGVLCESCHQFRHFRVVLMGVGQSLCMKCVVDMALTTVRN